jgi:soluble lytic murein transglycosylase-like protein
MLNRLLPAGAILVALSGVVHAAPDSLVRAIIHVESGGNPLARGKHGEIGLMQLKLETARAMGYRGSRAGLYDPDTNVRYGRAYLELAWRRAHGDLCIAASLFNRGVYARGLRCTAYGRIVVKAMRRVSLESYRGD